MTDSTKTTRTRLTRTQRREALNIAGGLCDQVADQLSDVDEDLLAAVVRELRAMLGELDLDTIGEPLAADD